MGVRSRLVRSAASVAVGSTASVTVLTIALTVSVSACASSDSEEVAATSTTTAAASALTTVSTVSTATPAPTDATVDVRNMAFSPATVTIAAGQTVTWNFDGHTPHAVQGLRDVGMEIDSPIVKTGEWSHTFAVPGSYDYICPLHPEMHGTVIVQ